MGRGGRGWRQTHAPLQQHSVHSPVTEVHGSRQPHTAHNHLSAPAHSLFPSSRSTCPASASVCFTLLPTLPHTQNAKYSIERDVLPDGTVVPAGAQVIYSAYVVNRLERYWGPDAAAFKPERWMDMDKAPTPYNYLTFNAGESGQGLLALQLVVVLPGAENCPPKHSQDDFSLLLLFLFQPPAHSINPSHRLPNPPHRRCLLLLPPPPSNQPGPRLCLGQRLAELEGVFVLTSLLARFRFRQAVPGTTVSYTLSATMPMQQGLMVVAEPRT